MRRSSGTYRSRTPALLASLTSRLGLVLAALAMLAQSLALAAPMPPTRAADARAAQTQLSALFGPGVVVCVQSDDPSAPPAPDGCDSCPLCRIAADAAALDLPSPPVFARPLRTPGAALAALSPPGVQIAAPPLHPLPRGPPSKT